MAPVHHSPIVLVIDEDKNSRDTIRALLVPDGFELQEAENPKTAIEMVNSTPPDVILLDHNSKEWNGLEFATTVRERLPNAPVIIITEQRDTRVAVQAIRRGIYDFLLKPLNASDLRLSVSQALEDKRLKEELHVLKGKLEERISLLARMGSSDKIQTMLRLLEKIAPTPYTVLIEGESGAGKELVARAIHEMSAVRDGQFVAVDCGAIPETLFESELFGHAKGAFTGAAAAKAGFFEAADNGTLFLDEVCNLSYTSQQKLLRAIEERKVQRIGATAPRRVNVRIIAATNRSLEKDVEDRVFRVDLLHRLKEVGVRVPALRERRDDICYLAQRFLEEAKTVLNLRCPGISREAMLALMDYNWPGNVRELRNVIRQAALTCEDNQDIQPRHLPFVAHAPAARREAPAAAEPLALPVLPPGASLADIMREYGQRLEKQIIEQAIQNANGNKVAAARQLQIDYKTLHRKRKQLGIK